MIMNECWHCGRGGGVGVRILFRDEKMLVLVGRLCESSADCHMRDSLNQGKVFFRVNTFPKLD